MVDAVEEIVRKALEDGNVWNEEWEEIRTKHNLSKRNLRRKLSPMLQGKILSERYDKKYGHTYVLINQKKAEEYIRGVENGSI